MDCNKTWRVDIDESAAKQLKKLDREISKRIFLKLKEISNMDNPRQAGKPLTGNLSGLWRYRVGDYRIICEIQDQVLVVFVIDINHRKDVYKHL